MTVTRDASTSPRSRSDFPILDREVNGKRLVYLDSAVIVAEAAARCSTRWTTSTRRTYANVHRGVYRSPRRPPTRYEARPGQGRALHRRAVARDEVVFTKNATEAINLVAYSWGRANLREGDVVVLTDMEHHANIVPWHILAGRARHRAALDPARPTTASSTSPTSTGCSTAPRLFAFTAMSNVLGTHQRRPPARRRRPRRRRAGPRRRLPVRAPHRHRRAGAGTPTSSPSPATRCAGRPASACCGAARSCSTRCRRSSAAAR